MYIDGSEERKYHLATYGLDFGYKDFIPMFTGEKFDADEWMALFKEAGAGYYVPVAEHHDGFQMYQSDLSDWNAYQMGPKRDVLGELKAAADKQNVLLCASSHRAEHWWFMGNGEKVESDVRDPLVKGDFYWPAMPEPGHFDLFSQPYPSEEYLNDWLARTAEIILKYQPKLLYFDWWIHHDAFKPYLRKLAAFYYNCGKQWGTDVMICYKHDAMMFGTGIIEVERGSFAEIKYYPWQTDTAVARNSWCHTNDLIYKSSYEVVCTLIDGVSKGGNLLLNVGPKADGSIPDGDRDILRGLGAWMRVNSEAINGSKPWFRCQEGPTAAQEGKFKENAMDYTAEDYRFTVNHGALYVIALRCPENGYFVVRSLADCNDFDQLGFQGIVKNVTVLGDWQVLRWWRDGDGLHVQTNASSDMPVVLKISMN